MDLRRNASRRKGSATIETAIALPIFLVAVFTLSSLVRYPAAWLRIEGAISDSARLLASGGYAAQLCGLLEVREQADALAQGRSVIGKPQFEALSTLMDALTAADPQDPSDPSGAVPSLPEHAASPLDGDSVRDAIRMASGILSAEIGNRAAELSDEALGQVAFALASWRLSAAAGDGADPWANAGIRDGKRGVSFSQSRYDGGNQQIEIVAEYLLKPASPFGLCPAVRCRHRVRVALWGAGVGTSLRRPYAVDGTEGDGTEAVPSSESLWNHPGDPASAWQRGQRIEAAELDRLAQAAIASGAVLRRLDAMQAGADAVLLRGDSLEVWQVFSLNPFLATYRDNPSAVRRAVLSEMTRMPETGVPMDAAPSQVACPVGMRHLVLVVPENAPEWIETIASDLMAPLAERTAVLQVRRGYGAYGAETEAQAGSSTKE